MHNTPCVKYAVRPARFIVPIQNVQLGGVFATQAGAAPEPRDHDPDLHRTYDNAGWLA